MLVNTHLAIGSYCYNLCNEKYNLSLNNSAQTWSYSNNQLSFSAGYYQNRYLAYSTSAWGLSNSGSNIYFYELKELVNEVTTLEPGKYRIDGKSNEIVKPAIAGTQIPLESIISFEFDKDHPLYIPLLHLINFDNSLAVFSLSFT